MVNKYKLKFFPFEICKQEKVARARMEAKDNATKGGGIHHGKKYASSMNQTNIFVDLEMFQT